MTHQFCRFAGLRGNAPALYFWDMISIQNFLRS